MNIPKNDINYFAYEMEAMKYYNNENTNNQKYQDIVDIYEGAFLHTRAVFRSEPNSCMNNNIPYYSAISRESIVKRIMNYSGESFSFEEFNAKDIKTATASTKATDYS